MKKYYLGLLISLFTSTIFGQGLTLDWIKSTTGTSSVTYGGMTNDAVGNIYLCGEFFGTVDFDPGTTTFNLIDGGSGDIFIQKLDSEGNFIWAKSFGNMYSIQNFAVHIDVFENVILTGYYYETVDFDPGAGIFNLTALGNQDGFVLKLDSDGDFLWAISIGSIGGNVGQSVTSDEFGNIYTTGYFAGTVDFDPGIDSFELTSNGSRDVFIQKLAPSGSFIWAKSIGGIYEDEGNGIALDDDGNVYFAGNFFSTVDFDPGANTTNITSNGSFDVFVEKLDSLGNFLWVKTFGGIGTDIIYDLSYSNSGNLYIGGIYSNTVDFNPGSGTYNIASNGSTDSYVEKMDTLGNFIWARGWGSSNADFVHGIALNENDDLFIIGEFETTIDFDPGLGSYELTSNGGKDIYIQSFNSNGDHNWAISQGDDYGDFGSAITIDIGKIYTAGKYYGTIDFDPSSEIFNITSIGFSDMFIQKLDHCPQSFATDSIIACSSYTWIDGTTYIASNNSATFTISGGAESGCDSIVKLALTINNAALGTDVQVACEPYTWMDGITYTSSNNSATFTFNEAGANGCDSVVTLDLTINSVNIATSTSGFSITADATGASYQWLDCDNGFAQIDGETGQTFTAMSNGNYAVEVTESGCSDTSACVFINSIGIIENSFEEHFVLYPNPTKGKLTLEFSEMQDELKLKLYSLSGKMIHSEFFRETKRIELNIDDAPGVYLLEIENRAGAKAMMRVVKE